MPVPPLPKLDPAGTESVLRAIFVNSTDAIGISHQNVMRVVNPAMLRLFGFEREEDMIGRSFLELMSPESQEELREQIRRRSDGESVPGRYRARAVRRDGTPFDVDITTASFVQGGQTFALGLLREVGNERSAVELYQAISSGVRVLISEMFIVRRVSTDHP